MSKILKKITQLQSLLEKIFIEVDLISGEIKEEKSKFISKHYKLFQEYLTAKDLINKEQIKKIDEECKRIDNDPLLKSIVKKRDQEIKELEQKILAIAEQKLDDPKPQFLKLLSKQRKYNLEQLAENYDIEKTDYRWKNKSDLIESYTQLKFSKKEAKNEHIGHNLSRPHTTFPMRANAQTKEPELQQNWTLHNSKTPTYFLHDGPPYANGKTHAGHALNKTLKDVANRYHELQGEQVNFTPGFDCHGLPTELKVLQDLTPEQRQSLTPKELRQMCRDYAKNAVAQQKTTMKRLGVKADWDRPYLTMDPQYEAYQLEAFGKMYLDGWLRQDYKPVWYSPSSQTALADAELEYKELTHKSAYVMFPTKFTNTYLLVWTSQPWTLLGNKAVGYNSNLNYALFSDRIHNYLLAKDLGEKLGLTYLEDFKNLGELTYFDPLTNEEKPLLNANFVNTEKGTGLVHLAPAHGLDDWHTAKHLGVEPLTDRNGLLQGLTTEDTTKKLLKELSDRNLLFKTENYTHNYPHDWRTKEPVLMMATKQWFVDVDRLKPLALEAAESVDWGTTQSKNRFATMLANRGDWCVSRQRYWGLPLPVFYHKETGEPLLNEDTLQYLVELFKQYGSDAWYNLSEQELLPEGYDSTKYQKGLDTMDVWLDSGLSWYALSKMFGYQFPADLYLEGSDQHRGWFQSSLLTSVALTGKAPYKKVLTHGFVLDEQGKKMSKSEGNVVDPMEVVNQYSADIFRLWAVSNNYHNDVELGEDSLKKSFENYKKFRMTYRFMLMNLFDYNGNKYELLPEDQQWLNKLSEYETKLHQYYQNYEFNRVLSTLNELLADMSANYFGTETTGLKARLYQVYPDMGGTADSLERRSGQYALHLTLNTLLNLTEPLLPHLATEVKTH